MIRVQCLQARTKADAAAAPLAESEFSALLKKAEPYWQRAQAKIAATLGEEGQRSLDAQLDTLSERISTA